jgi:16S rRNA (uracil1498-N3)-methyltransferase
MLPLFYSEGLEENSQSVCLDEDNSRHIVQVLRMRSGSALQLTNGKGGMFSGEIVKENKKEVEVAIKNYERVEAPQGKISICLSLLKNANRFEWFLEKATELGISELMPIICERTERQHFRANRMNSILVSAMLQSHQCWLPVLHEPTPFTLIVEKSTHEQKFIAHCIEGKKTGIVEVINKSVSSQIILIGPEGDFTTQEVAFALQHQFLPVALGETRLRSETAAMVAATLLRLSR